MCAAAVCLSYRYSLASVLSQSSQGLGLSPATRGLARKHPRLPDGRLWEAQIVFGPFLGAGDDGGENL